MSQEKETKKQLAPIGFTAEGLRDAIFDEINLLRAGKVTTRHARAMASLVHQVIDAARLEFQQKKFMSENGKSSLRLGSR